MVLTEKVQAYMSSHAMLPPDGRVLAACSGGVDSVALLDLLRGLPGVTVVCAHYNHGLRGAESDRDEEFVRGLAERLGLECVVGRGDVAAYAREQGMGIEAAARELRYRFLHEAAGRSGCSRIATGHNANDNAETVLFHLLRGSGAAGLSGIRPVRSDGVIRPLLSVTRRELEDYLRERGVPHVEDSTNADEGYARNALRRRVLPELEALNPAAVAHIGAAAESLREDEAVLEGMAEAFLAEHWRGGRLPVPPLLALPRSVALRALRRCCGDPGRGHLLRVLGLCAGGANRSLDLPGCRVRRERDQLCFGPPETPVALPRRALIPGGTLELPETGQALRWTDLEKYQEIHNSFTTFYFQNEKLCGRITVGPREAGDAIRLSGRNCTKVLRRLYNERGLTVAQRAANLVLSDDLGPIAVEGFGVAERVAAEAGKPAVRVEIIPMNN